MGRKIGKERFVETIRKACEKAGRLGEQIISRDKESFISDKRTYTSNIKKDAPAYKTSVKALKEAAGIRKLIPGGSSALLDIAESQAKSTVDRVVGYRSTLLTLNQQIKEVSDNENDLQEARKTDSDEYDSVMKLLKKKFIVDMRYESGVGLFWKYPPMVYIGENGQQYFLGRPEAGLSEINGGGFSLKLPSYKSEHGIGTFHLRNSHDGNDYCLGGYDEIVKILAAKRQVSSLIRIFKDYFLSYNKNSVHNRPRHIDMDINLPRVIDDSWEVWKKENPKHVMPFPAIAVPVEEEDEVCSNCGDAECEGC